MNNHQILFGIEFESQSHYDECLKIAMYHADTVNEDYRHCVMRERGLEAAYCRDNRLPFVAFDKELGVLDSNILLDKIDKSAWRIVLRLHSELKNDYFGIEPLQGTTDAHSVVLWPTLADEIVKYTKRTVSFTTAKMFAGTINKFAESGPLFIKTMNKGPKNHLTLHHIFSKPEDYEKFNTTSAPFTRPWGDVENAPLTYLFKQPDWFCPYRESMERGSEDLVAIDDYIVYSDVMNIKRDELDRKLEYRCFIVNGKPVSISRYEDYEDFKIPQEVGEFASEFASEALSYMPPIYVMDIAETDKGLQLVELNPYEHSGRYHGNKPDSFYSALAVQEPGSDVWYSWYKNPIEAPAGPSQEEIDLKEKLKGMFA